MLWERASVVMGKAEGVPRRGIAKSARARVAGRILPGLPGPKSKAVPRGAKLYAPWEDRRRWAACHAAPTHCLPPTVCHTIAVTMQP